MLEERGRGDAEPFPDRPVARTGPGPVPAGEVEHRQVPRGEPGGTADRLRTRTRIRIRTGVRPCGFAAPLGHLDRTPYCGWDVSPCPSWTSAKFCNCDSTVFGSLCTAVPMTFFTRSFTFVQEVLSTG